MAQKTLEISAGAGRYLLTLQDRDALREAASAWNRCVVTPHDLAPSRGPTHVTSGASTCGDLVDASGQPRPGRSDSEVGAVTSAAIDAGIGHKIMFHAAGLSDPVTHRTVALVAPSGTGKTTAVATLGQQFGYVTDETVIIDPQTLAITPFPKPLSVLGPSGQRPKALFSPDELGLLSTPMQPYLGAVVILARDPDHHDHPHLERLPLADALGHLLPQSSSLAALDRGLLDLARVLDQVGGCHILRYREIETVGPLLKNLLAAPPQAHTPNWAAVNLPTSDESAQQPADSADLAQSVIRRAPADDALLLPNHCLAVLSGTSFMLLQGLGPVIWETLVVPMPLDALVAQMVQQPHAPEDAEQVVRTAVDHLVERGVLIRSSGQ